MQIHECTQGEESWLALRRGIPTASEASKLVSNGGKISTQIEKYARVLAAELNGVVFQSYSNAAMERGTELEPEARSNYSLDYGSVEIVGFITNDEGTFGYSPDGFVGDDGSIEIKCVNYDKHCDLLVSGKYPIDYHSQIQAGLWVTGRQWCDLYMYYPGIPAIRHRVLPDIDFHSLLESQLAVCLQERDTFLNDVLLGGEKKAPTETKIDF